MHYTRHAILPVLAFAISTLTACGGGSSSAPKPIPQQPGQVALSASSYTVDEVSTIVAITIVRSGGSVGQVTVQLTAADGSASAGDDYTALTETLTFADGDNTSRTVEVTLIDDDIDEPDETILLSLSNVTGGATLGSPSTAEVVISDDEPDEFEVGISVTGLRGEGLTLRNNDDDDLPITADGDYAFSTPLFEGDQYDITVSVQPWAPAQTCSIANATGTVTTAGIDNIEVRCEDAVLQSLVVSRNGPAGAENMNDLYLAREDGESLIQLTNTPDKEETTLAVYGDRIVFSRHDPQSGESSLFSVRRDGTGTILLNKQTSPEFVGIAAKGIAVYNSGGNIYSVNVTNGLDHTAVLVSAESDYAVDVSIDGTIIVQRAKTGHGDLYATDIFGSQLIPLATSLNEERLATVTPQRRVVYEIYAPGNPNQRDIHSVSVAGGGLVPISQTPLADESILTWDDATGILIMLRREPGGGETLFSATADDKPPKQLSATHENGVWFQNFAPGERVIYQVERSNGETDVNIVFFDGTGRVSLAPSEDSEWFAGFSSDGAAIIHRVSGSQYDVYRVELDGSGETPLASTTDDELLVATDPDPARGRLAISRESSASPAQTISIAPDGNDERVLYEGFVIRGGWITRYGSLFYWDEEFRLSRVGIDGSGAMPLTPFAEPVYPQWLLED